jgi:hypothetical protein
MKHPVHAEYSADGEWQSTGISFSDYGRMSVHQHKLASCRRIETPSWAVNDSHLRELLVAFMEERAQFRAPISGTLTERLATAQKKIIAATARLIATIDKLCARYVELKRTVPFTPEIAKQATNLSRQIETLDTRLRFESKDGGLALVCGVIYRYYRLGLDSVGVGKELFIKPPSVRQIIWRLSKTWERLHPAPKPEATGRHRHALRQHVAVLEKLAAANDGRIPSSRWLCAHGYEASYDCLRGYPDAFAHLQRALRERTGKPRTAKPPCTKPERIATKRMALLGTPEAEQALALYKSGSKAAQIAVALGIKSKWRVNHVRQLLKAVGVDLPRQRLERTQWNAAQREQIVALYNSGSTVTTIKAQFGYAHRIRTLLKAAGVYQPHRDKARKPTSINQIKPTKNRAFQEQVLAYYKPGMAIADVAVHFGYRRGCGCNRVRGVLVRAGLYQLKQKPRQGGAAVVADCTDGISSDAPAHHPAA